MPLTKEEFKERVEQHKLSVQVGMKRIADEIEKRGVQHDDDKLYPEILEQFYTVSKEFEGVKFGTKEYQESLDKLKPAIDEHYKNSPHHPQFYKDGINGVNLLDLLEMIVDWNSASHAYGESDILKSIEINKERFGIDDQLFKILLNTAVYLKYV